MLLSVVLCTHRLENYQNVVDAVESLLGQSYGDVEVIVVVDGNERLSERIGRLYRGREKVRVLATGDRVGADRLDKHDSRCGRLPSDSQRRSLCSCHHHRLRLHLEQTTLLTCCSSQRKRRSSLSYPRISGN